LYECVIPEGTVHNWVKRKANYICRRCHRAAEEEEYTL
jgi:hypothetical protein